MKKYLLFSLLLFALLTATARPDGIDGKILAVFEKTYPHAEDVSWDELPDAYVVHFRDQDTWTRILFQKDHSLVYITRYYKKEKLPFFLTYLLAKELPGKEVFGVTEVSMVLQPDNQSKIEYYLSMEEAVKWYTVKIDADRNLSIIKKYRKAPGSRKGKTAVPNDAG